MRLADDVRKIVVFLGLRTKDKNGAIEIVYDGTGFFVVHDGFSYLITARHVAEALGGPFVIGVNGLDGQLETCDIDGTSWCFHSDSSVDVAVMSAGLTEADWLPFPSNRFARGPLPGDFGDSEPGGGDLVYIVGLYRLFPGKRKISPIVHTGHIAMAPDDEIPMFDRRSKTMTKVRGYLIEAQTLDGLSGSPVFVRPTNVTGIMTGRGGLIGYSTHVALLGLWSGSWDAVAGEFLTQQLGRDARVPVGMGVAIPAERITEVLDSDKLKTDRAKFRADIDLAKAATMDFAALSDDEATNQDENPDHQEDFTALVSAASKRKPKGDRT